jgi:hypothetical protein
MMKNATELPMAIKLFFLIDCDKENGGFGITGFL